MSGRFITIEGPDGAGKSTQGSLLAHELERLDHAVLFTHEPGGTALGSKIRRLLLAKGEAGEMDAMTELFLIAGDRAQHVKEVIRPALSKGVTVICDRYVDSSVAYQGAGARGDRDVIRTVNRWATGGLMPELTLLLDVDADTGRLRQTERRSSDGSSQPAGDRIESRERAFHNRVREGYHQLAAAEPKRIACISTGGKDVEDIHREVWSVVVRRFPELGMRPHDVTREGGAMP